jgi:hypothetical protein
VQIKKHEIYEKCGKEGISLRGNCGGEELKNFCLMFVYNLIISNSYECHQQM